MNPTTDIDELRKRVAQTRALLEQYQNELDDAVHRLQHREVDQLEEHLASTDHKLDDLHKGLEDAWADLGGRMRGLRTALRQWVARGGESG